MTVVAEMFEAAVARHQAGHLAEARDLYCRILQSDPDHNEALQFLGVIAYQAGDFDLALRALEPAVARQPNNAIAWNNLGSVYRRVGRIEQAELCFREAAHLKPEYAEAYVNLGNLLRTQGRLDEAATAFELALHHEVGWEIHATLGELRQALGQLPEATASYLQAITINPDAAGVYNNLGNVLCTQGGLDDAVKCFRHALRLKPDEVSALNNLGTVFLQQGKYEGALACFHQVLKLEPLHAIAHSNLLYALNYDADADADAIFVEHCRFGQVHGGSRPVPHANEPDPERRIRIGYVSPDLRRHALSRFLEPILAHHDPAQVETVCYSDALIADATSDRLKSLAHVWRTISGTTDEQLVACIRADGIDILVDLAGHTANNRLCAFAHKPAPIQVTYLGYINTTGLAAMDYRITDDVMHPMGEPKRDTEELVRLPGGNCCFTPPEEAPAVTPLPALTNGWLTFGSLHNVAKLNGRVFELWCQVLKAIPSARLLMYRDNLIGQTRDIVAQELVRRGVAAERFELRHEAPAGHLSVHHEIDLFLDVFPWSGGTTVCEALWMGVPVLTLRGNRFAQRAAASALTSVGLPEFIADSPDQFVSLAVHWASSLQRLAQLRDQLRERMTTTICDGRRVTRLLESAYRTMWRKWCSTRHAV